MPLNLTPLLIASLLGQASFKVDPDNPRPLRDQLLLDPRVQRELGLTEEQKRDAIELVKLLDRRLGEGIKAANERAEGTGSPRPNTITVDPGDYQQRVRKILKPEQRRRYDELMLQLRGIHALRMPDLREKFNIGPDQAAMIDEVIDNVRKEHEARTKALMNQHNMVMEEMTLAAQNGPPPRGKTWQQLTNDLAKKQQDAMREAQRARYRALDEAAEYIRRKVLTRKQAQRWLAALGKPFDFEKIDPADRLARPDDLPRDAAKAEPVAKKTGAR